MLDDASNNVRNSPGMQKEDGEDGDNDHWIIGYRIRNYQGEWSAL